MNLEGLSVSLRPRTDWEAVDLGLVLVRIERGSIYRIWWLVMVPILGLAVAALGGWGLLVTWWLFPLGEMAVLFYLSRAVFASPPTIKETLRAAPGLWRQGLAELTLRRINPMRSMLMPIGQLERLSGADRRERAAVLSSIGQGAPSWLPTVFILFELGFSVALLVLVRWMLPKGLGYDLGLMAQLFTEGALPVAAYRAAWLALGSVFLLFHPFVIAAGFTLYLDRRTVLEGWDLEIGLRRLARRLERRASVPPVVGLVFALLMAGAWLTPELGAQEEDPTSAGVSTVELPPAAEWLGDPERDPRTVAREVMSKPEFQRQVVEKRWRLRDFGGDQPSNEPTRLPFLEALGGLLALAIEPLAWIGAAVLVLLIARVLWRRLPDSPTSVRQPKPPQRLAGLDVRPESLPEDIPGTAEALWRDGQPAAALSLLYRGALACLGREGLELRESFTEDDCLRVAHGGLAADRATFFARLTRAWQRVAYAHQIPGLADAQPLWVHWAQHFGSGGGSR